MKFVVKSIDDYEQVDCYDGENLIGYINYKFVGRRVWLNKIEVNKEYRNNGVGSALLKIFENRAISMFKIIAEGKFYPTEDGNAVRKFYESFGYSIQKEGYETELFKGLRDKHDLTGLNIEYERNKTR